MSGVVRGLSESSVPVGGWSWRGNPAGVVFHLDERLIYTLPPRLGCGNVMFKKTAYRYFPAMQSYQCFYSIQSCRYSENSGKEPSQLSSFSARRGRPRPWRLWNNSGYHPSSGNSPPELQSGHPSIASIHADTVRQAVPENR